MKITKSNISIIDGAACTGCGTCASICPTKCITMEPDEEGFCYPRVSEKDCIHCGECMRVCAVCGTEKRHPISGYAATYRNEAVGKHSASGGMFPMLARYWLEQGGYVCAAKMLPNHEVQHVVTNRDQDLQSLQGSKYVQSFVYRCYEDMDRLLKDGKKVLFFGTPCQTAGVRLLFRRYDRQLCTVDLVCHGVPSPQFFREYISRVYESGQKLTEPVRFREKTKSETSVYRLILRRGNRTQRVYAEDDAYYTAFIEQKSLRECCYQCEFASDRRGSDITIGDCASKRRYSQFGYGSPISTVLVCTEAGKALWEKASVNAQVVPLDVEAEIRLNNQLHSPSPRPEERDAIYQDWKAMEPEAFCRKYKRDLSVKQKGTRMVKNHVPLSVKRIMKELLKK